MGHCFSSQKKPRCRHRHSSLRNNPPSNFIPDPYIEPDLLSPIPPPLYESPRISPQDIVPPRTVLPEPLPLHLPPPELEFPWSQQLRSPSPIHLLRSPSAGYIHCQPIEMYHSSSDLNRLLRSPEGETIYRDILVRLLGGPDYFSRDEEHRREGLVSAATLGGYGRRDGPSFEDAIRAEDVRRINSIAQLANSTVNMRMPHAEVHPKMTTDGRYPREFDLPKNLDDFLHMEGSSLDRLIQQYHIHIDNHRQTSLIAPAFFSNESNRLAKMKALLMYLGVRIEGFPGESNANISSSGLSVIPPGMLRNY